MLYQLKKLKKWTGFLGWVTLIGGIFYALIGIFSFGVGAIPGIISAFLGWKLITVSNSANEIIRNDEVEESSLIKVIEDLNIYFQIQSILLIIGFILSIILVIFLFLVMGAMFGGHYSELYSLASMR